METLRNLERDQLKVIFKEIRKILSFNYMGFK